MFGLDVRLTTSGAVEERYQFVRGAIFSELLPDNSLKALLPENLEI